MRLLSLFILIIINCNSKPQKQILSPDNYIIVSLKDAHELWKNQIKFTFTDTTDISFWEPKIKDIEEAEESIKKFLLNEKVSAKSEFYKRQLTEILDSYKVYKRQYVGLILNTEKIIWCNYLFDQSDKFKRNFDLIVLDGGSAYWRILYNLENKSCSNLTVNSEA